MDRSWIEQVNRIVGRRMRRCRLVLGLGRGEVALALGLSEEQYSLYENGSKRQNSETLKRFASILGLRQGTLTAGMARPIEAAGFKDAEQERYKIAPAAALRARIIQAADDIEDPEKLTFVAQLAELFGKR
ncbi:helix-turn-helix transcriptional regulator [Bosea sp. (in: a-proteobacteria)]|jgi:transcriptional regulator with XRE-family HTH domain|uniref:Helix-turn-helix domain-containing protein n=1 Tax=Bosea vestrisii TaxID=151416 RepID=A0ABW0H6A0_9HYPH|nr:helix-turn-helix transcriptional regulator [Bosea sp. (in: a-proteobacteria)]MBR3190966.1 helix-turn-helix transcriptional regulator [Bosea sp. (in: a-proteobacteria)]